MKTKAIVIPMMFLVVFICQSPSAFDNSVPLDGFNAFTFDSIGHTFNSYQSYTEGFSNDSFAIIPPEFKLLTDSTNKPFMYCKGFIGAENGEALLNKYEPGGSFANRDHKTYFTTIFQLPKLPLIIGYKYRYIDTYSDRYDSIWADAIAQQREMLYNLEGLSHEHLGIVQYQTESLFFSSIYNSYYRWAATPYYFSPLYDKGNSLNTTIAYNHEGTKVFSKIFIDKHDLYLDHKTPSSFNELVFDAGILTDITKTLEGTLNVKWSYACNPEALVNIGLGKHTDFYSVGLSGSLYSNNETSFYAYTTRQIFPQVQCSLHVANDYIPQARSYTFRQEDFPVSYNTSRTHQVNLYLDCKYQDTLLSPLKITAWYQHCNRPLIETIKQQNDTVKISQYFNGSDLARSYIGSHLSYQLPIPVVTVQLSGSVNHPINGSDKKKSATERFSMRKYGKIDFNYQMPGENTPSLSMSVLFRDKATLSYEKILQTADYPISFYHTFETYSSPSFATAQFQLRIPFISPLFRSKINNPAFVFDIGPVRFSKNQRILEHPKGNPIGPAIFASVEGYLK